MKQYLGMILGCPLFVGIGLTDLEALLGCMQAWVQRYEKGAVILLAGDPVETVGLVLSGGVQVVRVGYEGNQNMLTELQAGELFGEVFACAGIDHSPVTVIAADESTVLHLNFRKVITTCKVSCTFHQRLLENMLKLVAQKNLYLNQKLELLSKRTTRERLLLFFDQYRKGARQFSIPYSRTKLAAYLCVERSAMSAELSKMQRDGLITYKRNQFEIKI